MKNSVDQQFQQAQYLAEHGLYLPQFEKSACGVGLIANIKGHATRQVVELGVNALKALWHRGAVDADGKTGDGAGIHLAIPHEFFQQYIHSMGIAKADSFAVGMIFLPRTNMDAQERTRVIIESEIIRRGYQIIGWRQVPINNNVIGEKANATRPEIEQIVINNTKGLSPEKFETEIYVMRRRIEKTFLAENLLESYICSFSSRSIIYKGLFLAEQLDEFYPDLQDELFVSNFVVYHQRYSTNTFPSWPLAQPFRVIAHNGEINTLSANINWMRNRERRLEDERFGNMDDILPIIMPNTSDSGALDNVFEINLQSGRDLPEVKSLLMPEAWEEAKDMPASLKAFYRFAHSSWEPWDGPAAICAYHGNWVLAGCDRNGLRPSRYAITRDGLLVVGSESGMVKYRESDLIERGKLGPGQMIGVDLANGKLMHDRELKTMVAGANPYQDWIKQIHNIKDLPAPKSLPKVHPADLVQRQLLSGWSLEDCELILQPMAVEGKEATGSMGDDSPLAVLAGRYRGLHHFFRQNFAQVTNPPIDSLRERHVMSLATRLNNMGNSLAQKGELDFMELSSPVVMDYEFAQLREWMGQGAETIQCAYNPNEANGLRRAVWEIQRLAFEAASARKPYIILDNINIDRKNGMHPVPMILAAGAVHTKLSQEGLRSYTSINVTMDEALDVHHFAVLIGVGVTTINPALATASILDRHERGLLGKISKEKALENYKKAIDDGLLKIMSKMGISIISSYRGGYVFEAVGLSRALVQEFFPGLVSRISGLGMSGLQKILVNHYEAIEELNNSLPVGGFYRYRPSGEAHAWEANAIHALQTAVTRDSYALFKVYSKMIYDLPAIHIRDLLKFKPTGNMVKVEDVESITDIRKRLLAPGISLGALSPIAHETLSIAMNRIGAKSDSGEGGEDSARYKPRANGDNACSAIKQIASGRFGVTAEYLNNCDEIEIKMAQGAKPGEGGQLPGFKVSALIAKLRHSTEGVTLISPPPHHDIYSIEDLAQLIYDLKQINPNARVCVKLVARSGIGTIAAGVVKAKADAILISGHSGGTGASPQTSIKYAGLPWELGLAEAHQVLTLNNLRDKVVLRTDGGIKTGRDVVIAAILGAEEYGIGTASLVAMGCLMVRQCHSNTCPVGVCTQDEKLIEKFNGTPEKVVNLFSFVATEVREILAELGFTHLHQIIGRTELLQQVVRNKDSEQYLDSLDLNPLLAKAHHNIDFATKDRNFKNILPDNLDNKIIDDAKKLFTSREKCHLEYNVVNTDRTIGTKLASKITRTYGMNALNDKHVELKLRGTAGQSLGAFIVGGMHIELIGEANDYVAKGLSGGTVVVRPTATSPLASQNNVIIGNTCLYGATKGYLFAVGQAGERFAVRNSGATAVVEGCGTNGCEYMTGGEVMILGRIGDNFAAGMTGGLAFIYDAKNKLPKKINKQCVDFYEVKNPYWQDHILQLLQKYITATNSQYARSLVANWGETIKNFKMVVPFELMEKLPQPPV